jgi:hypothetical protein
MKTAAKRHYAKMSGHPLRDFFYVIEVVSDELSAYYSRLELAPLLILRVLSAASGDRRRKIYLMHLVTDTKTVGWGRPPPPLSLPSFSSSSSFSLLFRWNF